MKKLVATLLMVPMVAHADFWTGNDLYSRQTSTDSIDKVQAFGYVMGLYDAGVRAVFCPPTERGITVGQVNDMAKNWLANVPHRRNEPAERLVFEMFKQVWPCQNRNSRGGA
jgi:hypothetical protein